MTAYYWISFKDNNNFTNLFIKTIAVSFILKTAFELIASKFNILFLSDTIKTLLFAAVSAILGLFIGKAITHRCFNLILHKFHIGRTTNLNIWDDVIKPNTWVRVFMKDGSSYMGQYKYGEPFKSEPIIVLATYQKLDKDTNVVIDYSQDNKEFVMINTKGFDKIEITYENIVKQNIIFKIWNRIKEILDVN